VTITDKFIHEIKETEQAVCILDHLFSLITNDILSNINMLIAM